MFALLPLVLAPQKSLSMEITGLLGKPRAVVERVLGRPQSSSQNPSADPYWDQWLYKGTPEHVIIWWNKAGKMTQMNLERRPRWQESLQMYGLKGKNLRVRKAPMKNDPANIQILGIQNLPSGWNCYLHEHDLYFRR